MIPSCPKCASEYTYEDGNLVICPECGHEWNPDTKEEYPWKDVNGNELYDGDSVVVVKDLNVKGSPINLKMGDKIKNIKLKECEDGLHDIDCRVDKIGKIEISSKYVKKLQSK